MISLYHNTICIELCEIIIHTLQNVNQKCSSLIDIDKSNKINKLINNELSKHLKLYLINKNICSKFLEYDQFWVKLLEQSDKYINDEHVDYYDMKHGAICFMIFLNEGTINFDCKTAEALPGSLLFFPCNWAYSYKVCKPVWVVYGRLYINDNIYAQKRVEDIINQLQSK